MFDEIKSIMTETLSIPEDQITLDANLEADLGISSLELYDEIHSFITVGDIVDYISAHTK